MVNVLETKSSKSLSLSLLSPSLNWWDFSFGGEWNSKKNCAGMSIIWERTNFVSRVNAVEGVYWSIEKDN